ncbi:hypothetical protein [[Eubacterium] cellulosolvens]
MIIIKRVIVTGLIAGFISGIADLIFSVFGLFGIFFPIVLTNDVQMLAIYTIIMASLWGILWTLLYAFFYDYIPGKGVKRGLVYGLIIWIITPTSNWIISVVRGYYLWAIQTAIVTFFSVEIVYGLILGYIYRE